MRRKIKIEQQSSYDCGAACLCSVAAWYGSVISMAKARDICGCTKEGITIKGIIEGAKKLGLSCNAYKSSENPDISIFDDITFPAVAHMRRESGFFHFVTVYKIGSSTVTIMNPATGGFEKIPHETFLKEWSGYIILFATTDNFRRTNETGNVYKRLLQTAYKYKYSIAFATLCSIIILLSGVGNSLFLQQIIDIAIPQKDYNMLISTSLIIITLTISGLAANYLKGISMARLNIKIDNNLILAYLKKITELPPRFFQQYQPGDINARIGDSLNIRLFISDGIVSIIMSISIIAIAIPVMFHYSINLAILSVSFIPVYIGLYILSGFISKKYNKEIAIAGAKFESDVLQTITNTPSIRYYGDYGLFTEKSIESYHQMAGKLYKASKAGTGFSTSADAISKGLTSAILVSGAFSIFNNTITVGEFVSFYTLSSLFCSPLLNLANMHPLIAQAAVSAERLFEIMDLSSHTEEYRAIKYGNTNIGGDIIIENLTYSYPGRDPLFTNLNLKIEQGKITLLTGRVGAGKSTLISLLMRDYKVESNSIFCGNRDINTIHPEKWHKYISVVPQKFQIYNASVLDNITCGKKNPDYEMVLEICSAIGLDKEIDEMPLGIFTQIGDYGISPSGGQCQKIAIARVLYINPQVIIFDESTSFMDEESEKMVINHILHLRNRGKSIIIISHKDTFTDFADKTITIG